MKVIITGGCGFVGSNLACSYLDSQDEVVILDSLERKGSLENLHWLQGRAEKGQLQFHQIDLAEQGSVFDIISRCAPFEYVCHLAGQVAMTTSMQDPIKDFKSNAVATLNLLEACRKSSPDSLIAFSSSNKVYGDLEHLHYGENDTRYFLYDFGGQLDENIPLDFSTPYGCSKGAADQYVRDWARTFDVPTVVFRHSSIYGGRQFATFDQGWVGWFCMKALEQKSNCNQANYAELFTVSGTGKQVRDLLHIDDVVRLYRMAHDKAGSISGKVFNIGGGLERSLSIIELLTHLSAELGLPILHYRSAVRRKHDQDYFVANVTQARDSLGWAPSVSLDDGMAQMLEWAIHLINHD